MSRSIKDLRDFINVSRLSFRGSDSEDDGYAARYLSEDDDAADDHLVPPETPPAANENLASATFSGSRYRQLPMISSPSPPLNQVSHKDIVDGVGRLPSPSSAKKGKTQLIAASRVAVHSHSPVHKNEIRPQGVQAEKFAANSTSQCNHDDIVIGRPDSAVGMRRPPSALSTRSPTLEAHKTNQVDLKEENIGKLSKSLKEKAKSIKERNIANNNDGKCIQRVSTVDQESKTLDEMFQFVDASIISSWLQRSNKELDNISKWLENNENFPRLAHFLLSDFKLEDRKQLLEMEVSIILDEFQLAFKIGMDNRKIRSKDLRKLLSMVLREYPRKLLNDNGIVFILDVLRIFCNGKNDSYKKLLSNVKYSTESKEIAQWMLAMRAFGLIGICNGIISFFKGVSNNDCSDIPTSHSLSRTTSTHRLFNWIFAAIELDYVDVLEYFLKHACDFSNVSNIVDDQGRSLVFKAVICNRERILRYLIEKVTPKVDLNRCSNSGNSPIHAAISNGNLKVIKILLENGSDVNQCNIESEGATPLHLAVINGDLDIVKLLVENGADTKACMGSPASVTPKHLAKDLQNETILQYLQSF